MANTKQAQKMVRKIKRRTSYNRWWKKRVSDAMKTLDEILAQPSKDQTKLSETYQMFQKVVDKASAKGIIHKNKGARMKSNMANKVSKSFAKSKS